MPVDGVGDASRLGGAPDAVRVAVASSVALGLSGHGRPRQPDPQLGDPRRGAPVLPLGGLVPSEGQAVEGQRMEADVVTARQLSTSQRQRAVAIGLAGQRPQGNAHFLRLQAAQHADGAEMMAVQPLGEPAQHRVLGVGRDAFDDQLLPRHAERDQIAVAEQALDVPGDASGRGPEGRMPLRVHRVLVQRDGQLDEELGEVARRGGPRPRRDGVGHRPPIRSSSLPLVRRASSSVWALAVSASGKSASMRSRSSPDFSHAKRSVVRDSSSSRVAMY